MDFSQFDARNYPTLPPREGYDLWAETYEETVLDLMDRRLLARVTQVDWARVRRAVDLACGTGRCGAWLKQAGVAAIDGVDIATQMLAGAKAKGVYENLHVSDIRDTGLPSGSYDLVTEVLADEHLPELLPLYREAARLANSDGRFVLVGYHPHFLMSGVPTHFRRADGESVTIESHVHLTSDHVAAAHASGFRLLEMIEGIIDETWIAAKPKWARFRNHPVSFAFVWQSNPGR